MTDPHSISATLLPALEDIARPPALHPVLIHCFIVIFYPLPHRFRSPPDFRPDAPPPRSRTSNDRKWSNRPLLRQYRISNISSGSQQFISRSQSRGRRIRIANSIAVGFHSASGIHSSGTVHDAVSVSALCHSPAARDSDQSTTPTSSCGHLSGSHRGTPPTNRALPIRRPTDIAIPRECRELIDRGALVALNHSGGKDSQAMTILLSRIVPREQVLAVHAPLGEVEWPGTIKHIQNTIPDGVPLVLARTASGKTLLERIEERGRFPSSSPTGFRFTAWQRRTCSASSARPARAAGQSPHWAYAAGMSRLSCSFCILASRADLRRAAELRPGLYGVYAALEKRIGHTLSPSRVPLPELTGIPPHRAPGLAGA